MTSEPIVLEATNLSSPKERWRIEWDAEGASFYPAEDPRQRLRVYRNELATTVEAMPVLGSLALVVKHPVRKVKLKLDGEARALYESQAGLGVEQLKAALARRYKLALPLAALFLVGSLSTEMMGLGIDFVSIALGLVLLALWAGSRWRPHPALFLLDAAWFLTLAVQWLLPSIGERTWFSWTLAGVTFIAATGGIQEYFRYRRTVPRAESVELA